MKKRLFGFRQVFFSSRRAFTLIELLISMAIVGIIAGAVLVVTMNGLNRARLGSAVQTLKSYMPGLSDCYLRNIPVSPPNDLNNPSNTLCADASLYMPLGGNSSHGCIYNTSFVSTVSGGVVANGALQAGCRCSGATIATCQSVFQCDFATTSKCTGNDIAN